jgi:hemerythrin
MSLIAWRDEFSLGIDAVDHEHREMIDLINELDRSMRDNADHDAVVAALGEIYAQIAAHFALEEKMMRAWRYTEYPSHKQDHETLLDVLLELIDSVDEEGMYDRASLSSDLDRWFSDHFRTHDARLHHKLG